MLGVYLRKRRIYKHETGSDDLGGEEVLTVKLKSIITVRKGKEWG